MLEHKLIASASGAVLTLGDLMVWQWLKRRPNINDHHHGHHSGGNFNDTNVWLAYHYSSPSDYDVSPAFKEALDYPARLADLCKKDNTYRINMWSFTIATPFNMWNVQVELQVQWPIKDTTEI